MRPHSSEATDQALTLIEVLLVIVVLAVLTSLLLPAGRNKSRLSAAVCRVQLKNIGENFVAWSQNHEGRFPMQVSVTNGGSLDWIGTGSAIVHFRPLTNSGFESVQQWIQMTNINGRDRQLMRRITNYGLIRDSLLCPADTSRRGSIHFKKTLAEVTDTNISYFVSVDASVRLPNSILAGDRFLQVKKKMVDPGLFEVTPNISMGWSSEVHLRLRRGNLLFADGHVELTKTLGFVIRRQDITTNRLAIP